MIEIRTFTARGDEQELLAADSRMQTEFAYGRPGLLRRTTARADVGKWCVVTLWATVEDADRAEAAGRSDEVASAFWAMVDPDSVRVERYALLA